MPLPLTVSARKSPPLTTEAKIVQDADRLEALGGDWPGARICRFRGIGLGAV